MTISNGSVLLSHAFVRIPRSRSFDSAQDDRMDGARSFFAERCGFSATAVVVAASAGGR
jgi:hypothetical protein